MLSGRLKALSRIKQELNPGRTEKACLILGISLG